MAAATEAQYNAIVNQLKIKDSVKIVCIHNFDDDGEEQGDFVTGLFYTAKRSSGNRFDVYSEDGRDIIWGDFNGDVYDRYKFFKIAPVNVADLTEERQIKVKKAALEKKSTDDLIKLIKSSQLDLELSKEILRGRVEGLI